MYACITLNASIPQEHDLCLEYGALYLRSLNCGTSSQLSTRYRTKCLRAGCSRLVLPRSGRRRLNLTLGLLLFSENTPRAAVRNQPFLMLTVLQLAEGARK